MQAHHSQSRRDVSALQQQDPGALYDFNLDEELEMDLDEETMEAMFGQDLASDSDILGMWIPEVLDWPTWVCVLLCSGLGPPSPLNPDLSPLFLHSVIS